jgi:hypothetical protein
MVSRSSARRLGRADTSKNNNIRQSVCLLDSSRPCFACIVVRDGGDGSDVKYLEGVGDSLAYNRGSVSRAKSRRIRKAGGCQPPIPLALGNARTIFRLADHKRPIKISPALRRLQPGLGGIHSEREDARDNPTKLRNLMVRYSLSS